MNTLPVENIEESYALKDMFHGKCPACHTNVTRRSDDPMIRYCPNCGQRMDWNINDKEKETDCMGSKLDLSAPWQAYRSKLNALFGGDDEVTVSDVFSEGTGYVVHIEVKSHSKFNALSKLLPKEVTFGNVVLKILLYDKANGADGDDYVALFNDAFRGNPVFNSVLDLTDFADTHHYFVQFEPTVVQYFDDDLRDPNGYWTGLIQDVARDVFVDCPLGVSFNTIPMDDDETWE